MKIKRIRISLKAYEKVIRGNIRGNDLWTTKFRGRKPKTYCIAYYREENDLKGPVAMWESTGYGWVWLTWKYSNIFKRLLTKSL